MEQFPNKHLSKVRRESSDKQFEAQAEERNSYRAWYMKWVGAGKVSGRDLLREEAERVNVLVDGKVEREGVHPQDAADDIFESSEFEIANPNPTILHVRSAYADGSGSETTRQVMMPAAERAKGRIEFKEFLRSVDPGAEESIEKGDLGPASAIVKEIADAAPNYEMRHAIQMDFIDMVSDKIDTMVRAGDVPMLQKLLLNNDFRYIQMDSFENMPRAVFEAPEVRGAVREKLKGRSDSEEFLASLGQWKPF